MEHRNTLPFEAVGTLVIGGILRRDERNVDALGAVNGSQSSLTG